MSQDTVHPMVSAAVHSPCLHGSGTAMMESTPPELHSSTTETAILIGKLAPGICEITKALDRLMLILFVRFSTGTQSCKQQDARIQDSDEEPGCTEP